MSRTLDVGRNIFSLVIIRPKESFFEWLSSVLKKKELTLEEVFFSEECGVWIIPAIGTFDDEDDFLSYMNKLKPAIVKEELGRFGPLPDDVPQEITIELCEILFEFEIRDRAFMSNELGK